MRKKKAQITLFIIIGIVIVFGIMAVIYVSRQAAKIPPPVEQVPLEVEPVRVFVQNCLETVSEDALIFSGLQGGYTLSPFMPFAIIEGGGYVPVFLSKGSSFMPTIEKIQQEIARSIDSSLPECTRDFDQFKLQGYSIVAGVPNSSVIAGGRSMTITTNWMIRVNDKATLDRFIAVLPVRMGTIHSSAKAFIDSQQAIPGLICISCFSTIAAQNNLLFNYIPIEENKYLFNIIDNSSVIREEPYVFSFVVDYGG